MAENWLKKQNTTAFQNLIKIASEPIQDHRRENKPNQAKL